MEVAAARAEDAISRWPEQSDEAGRKSEDGIASYDPWHVANQVGMPYWHVLRAVGVVIGADEEELHRFAACTEAVLREIKHPDSIVVPGQGGKDDENLENLWAAAAPVEAAAPPAAAPVEAAGALSGQELSPTPPREPPRYKHVYPYGIFGRFKIKVNMNAFGYFSLKGFNSEEEAAYVHDKVLLEAGITDCLNFPREHVMRLSENAQTRLTDGIGKMRRLIGQVAAENERRKRAAGGDEEGSMRKKRHRSKWKMADYVTLPEV